MKRVIIIFCLILFSAGCTSIEWTGVYSRYIGYYGKYDQAIKGLNIKIYEEDDAVKKMSYYLLLGMAYQRKEDYTKSIEYYEKSLEINKSYNFFAYLQKALIYKLKNNDIEEKKNLELAISSLEAFRNAIINNEIPESDLKNYKIIDFNINYYIYKQKNFSLFQGSKAEQHHNYLKHLLIMQEKIKGMLN